MTKCLDENGEPYVKNEMKSCMSNYIYNPLTFGLCSLNSRVTAI